MLMHRPLILCLLAARAVSAPAPDACSACLSAACASQGWTFLPPSASAKGQLLSSFLPAIIGTVPEAPRPLPRARRLPPRLPSANAPGAPMRPVPRCAPALTRAAPRSRRRRGPRKDRRRTEARRRAARAGAARCSWCVRGCPLIVRPPYRVSRARLVAQSPNTKRPRRTARRRPRSSRLPSPPRSSVRRAPRKRHGRDFAARHAIVAKQFERPRRAPANTPRTVSHAPASSCTESHYEVAPPNGTASSSKQPAPVWAHVAAPLDTAIGAVRPPGATPPRLRRPPRNRRQAVRTAAPRARTLLLPCLTRPPRHAESHPETVPPNGTTSSSKQPAPVAAPLDTAIGAARPRPGRDAVHHRTARSQCPFRAP